jgi:hypothetical protein
VGEYVGEENEGGGGVSGEGNEGGGGIRCSLVHRVRQQRKDDGATIAKF